MRILIADDDAVTRQLVQMLLTKWEYEVTPVDNGTDACAHLVSEDGPSLAILDWMMPGLDGPKVCKKVRASNPKRPLYLILLTTLEKKDNIVMGLESGADDYLAKPFDPGELRARVRAGERVVNLESDLRQHVRELETALAHVKQLQGLLPICSYCKKIRDDQDYWHSVDRYIAKETNVRFSHGICPTCYDEIIVPQLEKDHVESGEAEAERK